MRILLPQQRRHPRHSGDRLPPVRRLRTGQHRNRNSRRTCEQPPRQPPPAPAPHRAIRRRYLHRIRLRLPLLLQQHMHRMPHFFQRVPQFAQRRARTSELLIANFIQSLQRCQAAIQIFFPLKIKSLRGLRKRLVEYFGSQLPVGNLLLTVCSLLVAFRRIVVANRARLFVLEPVIPRLRQRTRLQRKIQTRSQKIQRPSAQLQVIVFNRGIKRVPEILDESHAQVQALQQSRVTLDMQLRLGQPRRELQVLGSSGQELLPPAFLPAGSSPFCARAPSRPAPFHRPGAGLP